MQRQRNQTRDQSSDQIVHQQRQPQHDSQKRLPVQEVARHAGGQSQRDPIATPDHELLHENRARVHGGYLSEGKAANHDRQRLYPGVAALCGDNRHQRCGERHVSIVP